MLVLVGIQSSRSHKRCSCRDQMEAKYQENPEKVPVWYMGPMRIFQNWRAFPVATCAVWTEQSTSPVVNTPVPVCSPDPSLPYLPWLSKLPSGFPAERAELRDFLAHFGLVRVYYQFWRAGFWGFKYEKGSILSFYFGLQYHISPLFSTYFWERCTLIPAVSFGGVWWIFWRGDPILSISNYSQIFTKGKICLVDVALCCLHPRGAWCTILYFPPGNFIFFFLHFFKQDC